MTYKKFGLVLVGLIGCGLIGGGLALSQAKPNKKVEHPTVKKTEKRPVKVYRDEGNREVVPHDQLSHELENQIKAADYSGTALVVRQNKVVLNKGYGVGKNQQENTVETVYPLASLTKNLTGIVLQKQLQKNHLDGSTKLSKFYPKVPSADQTTLHQLWTMTADLSDVPFTTKPMSEGGYINNVAERVKANQPSGSWFYTSTNFILLSGIIRQLSGQSLTASFKQEFQSKYHFLNVQEYTKSDKRTIGYNDQGHPVAFNEQRFAREVGTGDLFATPWTMYCFLKDEFAGKVLPQSELSSLTTPPAGLRYAGGLYTSTDGQSFVGHGKMQGFEPTLFMDKNGENAVILFSNQNDEPRNKPLASRLFETMKASESNGNVETINEGTN
ncbi:class A beta-lactamase-related serine hydrolase [Weissella viridescens]|uniref:Class A beta-lactamase-related serine hydrolase n=1 Tax=Weissella viridescens TaxID=1629 RepID=A0A3P2RJL7_WEIVI|nr:serine hydrolase domain-containing protein [Weissella viridescens]RRG17638.1 class A beta-lactamase-related serine hydrolase [Weissella viridescens]